MRHVIFEKHVTQILQKQVVGPAEPELLMLRITQVLNRKSRLREFISLCQAIEDRLDPQSKWHELTVSSLKGTIDRSIAPAIQMH